MAKGTRVSALRQAKASNSGGSVSNGFNGEEHAVQVVFDDNTALRYRIKGTQMYVENWGSNISPFGNADSNTYDVPVNQAEILMNNAKNMGAKTIKLITPKELKDLDDKHAKQMAKNSQYDPSLGLLQGGMVAKKHRQRVIRNRRSN